MPTINYVDLVSGNDGTGTGAWNAPYLSIDKGTTGLTGGDECRVAKTTAPVALSGTVTFTAGSATINTTSDLRAEVAVGDLVGLNIAGAMWWEVTATAAASITIRRPYHVTGGAGLTLYKVVPAAVAAQSVHVAGSSTSSRLKISFGWTLAASSTRDAETYMKGSGRGSGGGTVLTLNAKNFIWVLGGVFSMANRGIDMTGSYYNLIDGAGCYGCYDAGIYASNSIDNTIQNCLLNDGYTKGAIYLATANRTVIASCKVHSSERDGLWADNDTSNFLTITDSEFCRCGWVGMHLGRGQQGWHVTNCLCSNNSYQGIQGAAGCENLDFTNVTCNTNARDGVEFTSSGRLRFANLTTTGNTNYGFDCIQCADVVIEVWTTSTNGSGDYLVTGGSTSARPQLFVEHYGSAGTNFAASPVGLSERDGSNGRSGACEKVTPSSTAYYHERDCVLKAQVASGVATTLKVYLKSGGSWDGVCEMAAIFLGKNLSGWVAKTITTSWAEYSVSLTAGNVSEDGVAVLAVRFKKGTAGYVWLDDASAVAT